MMSVVIAASGIAARTRSRMPRNLSDRYERRIARRIAVRARLQRHVQLGHDGRRLRHRLDDVVGERGRVRRREPQPLEPLDRAGGAQQPGERAAVTEPDAVGVHVLSEQRHLDGTLRDERLDLGEDLPRPAVALLAAQVRARCRRCTCCCSRR